MKFRSISVILRKVVSSNFWKKPKKTNYLIVDKSGSDDLFNNNIIAKNETYVLSIRSYEWLNIHIIFWLIKERKYSLLLNERFVLIVLYYLQCIEPKFVVTWMDYIASFYKLKALYPKAIFISLQVGRRSNEPGEFFDRIRSMQDDQLSCDYIFSFGEAHAKEYEKYINCKAIPSGSIRNNNIPILHNKNNILNKHKILFISQYRKPKKNNIFAMYGDDVITWDEYYKVEHLLLPMIVKYCKNNSLSLYIAASIESTMELEKKFYNNLIGSKNYNYIETTSNVSNYEVVDEFPYIVGIDSTLLSEALGRGKRVAFFDCRGGYTRIPDSTFGWPMKLELKGKFWTNDIENSDVKILLDYIINISDKQWEKDVKSISSGLMNYDDNNLLLRKVLS